MSKYNPIKKCRVCHTYLVRKHMFRPNIEICSETCNDVYIKKQKEKRYVSCNICDTRFPNSQNKLARMVKICQEECLQIHRSRHKKSGYMASVYKIMRDGMTLDEAIAIRNKKTNSILSEKFWMEQGMTTEQAKHHISTLQKKRSPRSIEYFLEKGHSYEEQVILVSEFQSKNSNNICPDDAKKRSRWQPQFWIQRGYSNEEANELVKNNGQFGAHTLDNYMRHYGDAGIEKYASYIKRMRELASPSYYIDLYGEEDGISRYFERFKRNTYATSKIQLDMFTKLVHNLPSELSSDAMYSDGTNREYLLITENRKFYFYDFVLPSLKLAIEFHGDFWHGNPSKFSENDTNSRWNGKTAKELWEHDLIKKHEIENRGFTLITIWEQDYMRDQNGIINQLTQIIKEFAYGKNNTKN